MHEKRIAGRGPCEFTHHGSPHSVMPRAARIGRRFIAEVVQQRVLVLAGAVRAEQDIAPLAPCMVNASTLPGLTTG